MRLFASLFLVTLVLAGCAPAEYCATFDDPDMQALCAATDVHYIGHHEYFGQDDPNPHYNTGMMVDATVIESFGKRYAVVNCRDSTVYTCTGCDDALWQEYRERNALFGKVMKDHLDVNQVVFNERKQVAVVLIQSRFAIETAPGVWEIHDRPRDTGADMETADKLQKISKQLIKTASMQ